MKKTILTISGVAALMLGSVPVTALASTQSTTPSLGCRYKSNKASYYDKSSSDYYHGVWTSAKNNWNNTGVFKWTQSSNVNCRTFTSSVERSDGDWASAAGMTYSNTSTENGYQAGASIYVNRYILKKYSYSKGERVNVATHEMGHAIGLDHNSQGDQSAVSVMNYANRDYGIKACDIRGVKAIYGINSNSMMHTIGHSTESTDFTGILNVDWDKNYEGESGIKQMLNDSTLVVQGTISGQGSAQKDSETDLYTTNQKLSNVKDQEGNKLPDIDFSQLGTTKVLANNTPILTSGDHVIVTLVKDENGQYHVLNNEEGIFIQSNSVSTRGKRSTDNQPTFVRQSDKTIVSKSMLDMH